MNRKEGIRPYELLVVFRRTLPANSTRLKIYDNVMCQAQKDKRLPHQAQAVYDAILHKMRDTLRESVITKQTRVETEFTQLEMGRLPHSAFLTEWERMLIVLDDAGIQQPDEGTLFRRYLQKLVPELRAALLSRTWVFPQDPGSPPRKPRTWAECAECAAQELESRADAKAPREMVNAISIGTVHTCGYCRRQDHHMEICPKRSADLRGDSAKCMADFEMSGRTCSICHHSDHTEDHHRLAVTDLMIQAGRPGSQDGSPNKNANGVKRANDSAYVNREDGGTRKCKFREDCRQWMRGECTYIHDSEYSGPKLGGGGGGESRKGSGRGKSGGAERLSP